MNAENKMYVWFAALGTVAFVALCVTAKACNDSDNQLRHEAFAHQCALVQTHIICPVIK